MNSHSIWDRYSLNLTNGDLCLCEPVLFSGRNNKWKFDRMGVFLS